MGSKPFVSVALFRRFPLLFRWLERLTRFETLTLVRESDVSEPHSLKSYPLFRVVRAWWVDCQLVNLSNESRESSCYYRFSDVGLSANRRGGFLRAPQLLIVPENGLPGLPRVYFSKTNVAGIFNQVRDLALVSRVVNPVRLERGIFAGSMAPHNWFHWTIDNLATLYQARYLPKEFAGYPLLVPAVVKHRPNWMAALNIVSSGREVVFLEEDKWFRVGDLVRIEGITRPNPRPQLSGHRARVGVLEAPLLDYRCFVVHQLGLDSVRARSGRRLFIGRKASEVREYNQEEIYAVAERYAFERVYLEELSFEDSVRVFREAEVIAGPHGAGWANLLFCNPSTKAMLWTWEGEEEDNWYENIALVSAVNYVQLAVPVSRHPTLDSRVANYRLDPDVFEQALRTLVARDAPSGRSRRGHETHPNHNILGNDRGVIQGI